MSLRVGPSQGRGCFSTCGQPDTQPFTPAHLRSSRPQLSLSSSHGPPSAIQPLGGGSPKPPAPQFSFLSLFLFPFLLPGVTLFCLLSVSAPANPIPAQVSSLLWPQLSTLSLQLQPRLPTGPPSFAFTEGYSSSQNPRPRSQERRDSLEQYRCWASVALCMATFPSILVSVCQVGHLASGGFFHRHPHSHQPHYCPVILPTPIQAQSVCSWGSFPRRRDASLCLLLI